MKARRGQLLVEAKRNFCRRVRLVSKLDSPATREYPALPLDKRVGVLVSVRFMMFAVIGGLGVLTHLAILRLAMSALGLVFPAGQAIAAAVAMTGNFLLNNAFTYRDQRLRGRALLHGLFSFYAVCGAGVAASVALASYLFAVDFPWWLAAIGGAAVSVVWNYAMSSILVWRSRSLASRERWPVKSLGRRGREAT
jgi:dolichol-phosphate mannosyltransferase